MNLIILLLSDKTGSLLWFAVMIVIVGIMRVVGEAGGMDVDDMLFVIK